MKWFFKNDFERTLARIEKALNLIGYIPFVSILSAAIRSFGGILQIASGLCFSLLFFCLLTFSKPRKVKHFFFLKTSLSYAVHGLCNFIRAKIEAIPFLSLVICLPYDRLWKKRFRYDAETYVEPNEIEI